MNEATNEGILNIISVLLVIGAFAVGALFYLTYDMEQDMLEMREGERDVFPALAGMNRHAAHRVRGHRRAAAA